jgi:hypothetical protein
MTYEGGDRRGTDEQTMSWLQGFYLWSMATGHRFVLIWGVLLFGALPSAFPVTGGDWWSSPRYRDHLRGLGCRWISVGLDDVVGISLGTPVIKKASANVELGRR